MGQGAEDAGGYEMDCNPYEEGICDGNWTERSGTSINIRDMTVSHLHGARNVARQSVVTATFSCDSELFEEWVRVFDEEIERRRNQTTPKVKKTPKKQTRGAKQIMICHCGQEYEARKADVKRGWGLSCSKSCAATRRQFGRPPAVVKID